jgi:hypothetical protein
MSSAVTYPVYPARMEARMDQHEPGSVEAGGA